MPQKIHIFPPGRNGGGQPDFERFHVMTIRLKIIKGITGMSNLLDYWQCPNLVSPLRRSAAVPGRSDVRNAKRLKNNQRP